MTRLAGSTRPAKTASLRALRAVPGPKFPVTAGCSMRSVEPISVAGFAGSVRTLIRTCRARSPSMMSFPPRPSMVSPPPPPSRMLPSPQTLPDSGADARRRDVRDALRRHDAVDARGREARHDLPEPADAVQAGLVERVAAGEAGAADRRGRRVVALDHVVGGAARVGLGLLPADAVDHDRDRQAGELVVDLEVVVRGSGVELVERPVEPAGARVAVDRRVLLHDVVAALGVVVVLPGLADEDVVAGVRLGGVVEERRAVVALEQVLAGAALDPVVATVAEHGIGALAGVHEVVARAGERLVVVRAALGEVVPVAGEHDVVAGTAVDGVVAVTALEHVGAVEVGDDVVAGAAERPVVAAVALEDVVA